MNLYLHLNSSTELKLWADRQKNCIKTYIESIKSFKKYLYKVIYKDEEATLELIIGKSGVYMRALLGYNNEPVSIDLQKIVN